MRSLWSGISGLSAHQTAMDVEGNNIANVNTVGYKYSRTIFQDLLSQSVRGSTSPQGKLGGKNAIQVGSGTTVATIERIHSQGSNQNTDKQTDLSIQGDGFFVVSGDNGNTYSYTRAGNFNFDANGNYVMPNGMIVQGWLADSNYDIDATKPIENIKIDPNMTTSAKATSKIEIDANLNSGIEITHKSPLSTTLDITTDISDLYTLDGTGLELKADTDKITLTLKRTYDLSGTKTESSFTRTYTYGESTSNSDGKFKTIKELLDEINHDIRDSTGIYNNRVVVTGDGKIAGAGHITGVVDSTSTDSTFNSIFENIGSGTFQSEALKNIQNGFLGSDDVGEIFNEDGDAFLLKEGQGIKVTVERLGETRNFLYRKPDEDNELDYLDNDFQNTSDILLATADQGFRWMYDSSNNKAFMTAGQKITITFNSTNTGLTSQTYTYATDFTTIQDLLNQIKVDIANAGKTVSLTFDSTTGQIKDEDGVVTSVTVTDSTGAAPAAGTPLANLNTIFSTLTGKGTATNAFKKNDTYYFTDIQELVNLYQKAIDDSGDANTSNIANEAIVSIDSEGRITIKNTGTNSFNITTEGYPDAITANQQLCPHLLEQ